MEKQNSKLEHGQPMKQTRGLFCMCDSGVARCQSQHQCHFWHVSLMFEAYYTGKLAWQLFIKFCVIHEAMNGCNKYKGSLKDCFLNVNIS